jgi:hypothetical protein
MRWTSNTEKRTSRSLLFLPSFASERQCRGATDAVASTAPPQHRLHQKAAQAVLKALLPEVGTDIKGHMRSQEELLAASGYGSHPNDFADLLRMLDGELRLITPTDPEGQDDQGEPGGVRSRSSDARYYHWQRGWNLSARCGRSCAEVTAREQAFGVLADLLMDADEKQLEQDGNQLNRRRPRPG